MCSSPAAQKILSDTGNTVSACLHPELTHLAYAESCPGLTVGSLHGKGSHAAHFQSISDSGSLAHSLPGETIAL